MDQRLLICLFVSALVGVGSAIFCVVAGYGVLAAFGAYMLVSSTSVFVLAVATMPRPRKAPRPVLLPAPAHRTVA